MSWGEVLAGIGGAARGAAGAQLAYSKEDLQREMAQLRADLARVAEDGRQERHGQDLTQREEKLQQDKELRTQSLNTEATRVGGLLQHIGTQDNQGQQKIDQAGQFHNDDLGEAWGAKIPAMWYGLQTAHDDRQYNTDTVAATSRGNAQLAADTKLKTAPPEKASLPISVPVNGPLGASPQGVGLNEAYLATLPQDTANKVKALVQGRLQLPTRFAKGDTYWQSILDGATKYDPSFEAGDYNKRSKARTDFTNQSGKGGQQIGALNTALQHTAMLSDAIDEENNSDIPMVNKVLNPLRTAVGSTKVTNFNAIAPQQLKEIESLWSKSGGTVSDLNELRNSLSANMGKQQQKEAVQKFMGLLKGKLDTLQQQRDSVLGDVGNDIPIIYPDNQKILDRILGTSSGAEARGQGNPQATGATPPATGTSAPVSQTAPPVRMKAPNGQVMPVPADQVEHYKAKGAVVVP